MGVRRALLVGMRNTNTKDVLPAVVYDIIMMRYLLVNHFYFEYENIAVMMDDDRGGNISTAEPTAATVGYYIHDQMVKRSQADDFNFFYFSGHGNRRDAKPNTNSTNFVEFMETSQVNTISTLDDIFMRQTIECVPTVARFAFIADSCSSGGLIEGAEEQIGSSNVQINRVSNPPPYPGEVPTGRDLGVLMSSCQTGTKCGYGDYYIEDFNRMMPLSHFTKAIIDVVKETDGAATLSYHDVTTRVNQKFQERGIPQTAGLYCSAQQAQEHFLR